MTDIPMFFRVVCVILCTLTAQLIYVLSMDSIRRILRDGKEPNKARMSRRARKIPKAKIVKE